LRRLCDLGLSSAFLCRRTDFLQWGVLSSCTTTTSVCQELVLAESSLLR
jgi:hypothetical protein